MTFKPSAFSGSWYPGSGRDCERAILGFVQENQSRSTQIPDRCIGGIVPHAGWVYSGRIACRVIQALVPEPDDDPVETIVLFGGHMRSSDTGFVLVSGGVDTPLGSIETDEALAGSLAEKAGLAPLSVAAFPDDNTLELQYPFVRYFLPHARLVSAAIPPSQQAERAAQALVEAAGELGRKIRILGSTDMTHYGPNFGFVPAGKGAAAVAWVAKENDGPAVERLSALDAAGILSQGLKRHSICCSGAAAAAAAACKKKGAAKGICLDYATSFETSRSDSFVGYCGMVYPY